MISNARVKHSPIFFSSAMAFPICCCCCFHIAYSRCLSYYIISVISLNENAASDEFHDTSFAEQGVITQSDLGESKLNSTVVLLPFFFVVDRSCQRYVLFYFNSRMSSKWNSPILRYIQYSLKIRKKTKKRNSMCHLRKAAGSKLTDTSVTTTRASIFFLSLS